MAADTPIRLCRQSVGMGRAASASPVSPVLGRRWPAAAPAGAETLQQRHDEARRSSRGRPFAQAEDVAEHVAE